MTARVPPNSATKRHKLNDFWGRWTVEESLFGGGLPQCCVTINMRRQPTLKSFGVEDRTVNWIVVAHCPERVGESTLPLRVEIWSRREHAMIIGRRRPYLRKAAFRHETLHTNS